MITISPALLQPATSRRTTLRLLSLLGLTLVAGRVQAASPGWPEAAFKQTSEADALKELYGKSFEMSDKVTLDAPEIAENGAVVPVSVSSTLSAVTSISILVPENPFALAASYKLSDAALPQVGCRLKMAKTSKVIAIVESGGKLYATVREVKVTLGGCGG